MAIDRRSVLGLSAGGAAGTLLPSPASATPQPLGSLGLDVTHFGVNAGSPDDQSAALQRAIDASAEARVPLWLPAGNYIAADLILPSGAQLYGVRGATRLVLGYGASIVATARADQVTLQGIVFDGRNQFLPPARGLISLRDTRGLRIFDCYLQESGGIGISLIGVEGEVAHCTVTGAERGGIDAQDSRGLTIMQNSVFQCHGFGIAVSRTQGSDDATQVLANRVEHIRLREGRAGHGITLRRTGNAVVADNHIRQCAGSAVHGEENANLHIRGNTASGIGGVAFRCETALEGAVVSGNTVDGAAGGIALRGSATGARLAVCQGNLIRNVRSGDPGGDRGVGIAVEADAAVTGNVIEGAPLAGILAGFGKMLRDITVTGNVVRTAPIGVGVSADAATGSALIAHNMIADATAGAVVGLANGKPVTGDLTAADATRFAQVTVTGNRVR